MKTTLIFDMQNIAMRSLFMCSYAGAGKVSTFDTDEECGILVRKIATDMSYVLRLFCPDRVIVATDCRKPWRHEIYNDIPGEAYKGTRTKDATKNWDKIFRALDDYKSILKSQGFVVTEIDHAEADDIAAMWKERVMSQGESVILVSSDKDWLQLTQFEKSNNTFCICYNPIANPRGRRKLFVPMNFNEWLNTEEQKVSIFFDNYDPTKQNLRNIQNKDQKLDIEEIDSRKVVLEKIMCGDDGDNVPSIYQYYKSGKKVRMTPAKSKKILQDLNVDSVQALCEAAAADALLPEIEKSFKLEITDIDINVRVMRQRKLVELNSVLFPDEILKAFEKHAKKSADFGYFNTSSITKDIILKDTKYLDPDYKKPRENGIFDNIKDLEKYISKGMDKPLTGTSLF